MNHVLVTGASGFLGKSVWDALVSTGQQVVAVDTREAPGITVADISDADQLDRLFHSCPQIDAIVHLAAAGVGDQGLVAGAESSPTQAVRINVEGLVNIIEAAARHDVKRVLWSSSTTIYGPAEGYDELVDESAPLRPTTTYGATKAACEHLGPILASRLHIDVVSVRLPMVYGADRWYGGSQAQLVNLMKALRTGEAADITGWTGAADWIHVADAAEAMIALLNQSSLRAAYHVLGHRSSLADLVTELLRAAEDSSQIKFHAVPEGAPNIPAIDDSLFRGSTGWSPRFPDPFSGALACLQSVGS
jgi:nucleoside-diphosphate-sugar epimerase